MNNCCLQNEINPKTSAVGRWNDSERPSGNSTEFDAVWSARSSEIQIKTYRCPINEIFSALFIRRDARFGRKGRGPETSRPFSVHAWFHLTLITDNLRHRNSICRWAESAYVNVSRRVVKVFAAVHSLNRSIDIWHRASPQRNQKHFSDGNLAAFFFFFRRYNSKSKFKCSKGCEPVNWAFLAS